MGTRAIYFFEDHDGSVYGVYKHYDNYPSGAADFIENAKAYAWEFPRFEADDFAAAFVAANKAEKGGEVRLLQMFDQTSIDMVMEDNKWCDYYYVITFDREENTNGLVVEIWETRAFTSENTGFKKIAEMSHERMKHAYREAS